MKIDRFLDGLEGKMEDPVDVHYMAVVFPGDLDPFERHFRYSTYLDAELRLAGLGCSEGGGTMFGDVEDDEREPEILFCVVDVDATDVDGARALLRLHLPELGCPPGTLIQYGEALEDRYDGADWLLAQPRSFTEE